MNLCYDTENKFKSAEYHNYLNDMKQFNSDSNIEEIIASIQTLKWEVKSLMQSQHLKPRQTNINHTFNSISNTLKKLSALSQYPTSLGIKYETLYMNNQECQFQPSQYKLRLGRLLKIRLMPWCKSTLKW